MAKTELYELFKLEARLDALADLKQALVEVAIACNLGEQQQRWINALNETMEELNEERFALRIARAKEIK
jgi:hypothetical protein